jgi:16S rRNA (guanine966-N2)-methyltransferase
MRVVAGTYRGRPLVAPKGMGTRPTADRVREALFSILFDVTDRAVLDLYAGTGALGIEALSRGARHATFVEHDRKALTALERNLATLRVPPAQFEIMPLRVEHALARLSKKGPSFDLVLADPPYREAERVLPDVLRQSAGLVRTQATIVLELASTDPPPAPPEGFELTRTKRYGETALAFYASIAPEPCAS